MRTKRCSAVLLAALVGLAISPSASGADPAHPVMKWVKRHPMEGAAKPSPRMGYETAYGYDPVSRLLVRYGGHNQGGGGEQNSEVWTYDLDRDSWTLKEPNDAPPGVCCAQQDVFEEGAGRFIRFPAFSGSHGWQSYREIRLKDSSVWTYDLAANTWRNRRPCPAPRLGPLRGAAYEPFFGVTVVDDGEGTNHGTIVYDLHANTWHQMKPPNPKPEPGESQPGFTYDKANGVFVRFGSQFGTDTTTWLYDLTKNAWRVLQIAEHPPADVKESGPILAADTRGGIVLCSIRHNGRHETWALDVRKAKWTRLELPAEPDPSGGRSRVLVYLEDRNLFVLENSTSGEGKGSREQQIWTFRYAEAPPPQPRPELTVTSQENGAVLSWNAPPGKTIEAWNVYRAVGEPPWKVAGETIAKGAEGKTHKDTAVPRGRPCWYWVRAAGAGGEEGEPSRVVALAPPVVEAVTVSVAGPKRMEIEWSKPPSADVVGYHVERADASVYSSQQVRRIADRYKPASDLAAAAVKAIGAFKRLTDKPLSAAQWADETVDLTAGQRPPAEPLSDSRPLFPDQVVAGGKPYRFAVYAYRVIAVNRLGVESGPSPLVFTWPSAVQFVFSKEEGQAAARLKWKANPEKGICGYLVYRHDGRYDKEPIIRLTPEPITVTEFLDESSGKDTRRYEVVAVDALGQEGEPSQPVWSRREWARYYVPYVGEWHQ